MAGIFDSFMGMLGPPGVGPGASKLGESPETVQRGLQMGSAAMLAGLASKAGQPGFLSQIFGLVTNPANTSGHFPELRPISVRWRQALRVLRLGVSEGSSSRASLVRTCRVLLTRLAGRQGSPAARWDLC